MVLRDYQISAIDRSRAEFMRGSRSVLLVAPTGAGKGTIAAHIMMRAVSFGKRALFVVHRKEIVADVFARIFKSGITDIGMRLDGKVKGNPYAPIQVCAIQTLTASGADIPADLIVWDEAHHCVASTYEALRAKYPQAQHLGLTATPERGDRAPLGDCFQKMVVVSSVRKLTEEGWLVPCEVIAPARYIEKGIAEDPVTAYLREANGRKAIFFCDSVNESKIIAEKLGSCAVSLDGKTNKEERANALAALEAGRISAITNMMLLTEGVDLPSVEVCVLARGCDSSATFLQMVGRVLRKAPGKTKATLIDLKGAVHVHGLPDEDRRYSLTGKAITRASSERIQQCRECGAVFAPATKCPRCGATLPPREPPAVSGDKISKTISVMSMAEKHALFVSLCEYAEKNEHNPISIGIQFKKRVGHWPPWAIPGFTATYPK